MERADFLRKQIASYRLHLEQGVDGDRARVYLKELAMAKVELDQLDQMDKDCDKRQ